MKNTKLFIRIITTAYTLVSLSLIGCGDKIDLPPSTDVGANTFGVKINDHIWLPEFASNVFGAPEKLSSGYLNNTIGIVARKGVNKEIITLTARNIKSTGTYPINDKDDNGITATNYSGNGVDDTYILKSGANNIIRITKLDTVSKIISGTFEMQLIGKNKNSILNFTHGTFDVKYEK